MRLILRWLLNAVTVLLISVYIPGIHVSGFYAALLVVLVLGLVNAIIRPLLVILTLPINILTLGLFTFVINALMFWLVSTVVKGFVVVGFWPAFLGALLLSIASWFFSFLLKRNL